MHPRDRHNEHVTNLRYALTGPNLRDIHPNIWYNNATDCSFVRGNKAVSSSIHDATQSCYTPTPDTLLTVADKSQQPFASQLQSNFSTGLIRQFNPRLNSSIAVNATKPTDFPTHCKDLPGSFYAEYFNVSAEDHDSKYHVQVCMPANQTLSPWKQSRVCQDIQEVLYLNISLGKEGYERQPLAAVFKIVANTNGGYFELPNYMNGNIANQVLTQDSNSYCDHHCKMQGSLGSTLINNIRWVKHIPNHGFTDRYRIGHDAEVLHKRAVNSTTGTSQFTSSM
jgi:hypothetical protein